MKNRIIIISFIAVLIASAVVLWLPADTESVTQENRTPATMPPVNAQTLASGDFSSGFEAYLGDNLGFRSFFTDMSEKITENTGFTTELGKLVSVNKDVGTGTTQKASLLVANDTVMEVFSNREENSQWYLNLLEYYADNLDEDVHLYSMIIPTQLEFQDEVYSSVQDSQKEAIDYIYANMPERIRPVDAYGALEKHKDEYIYYRTDHHWTALGAYYGYCALLNALADNDPDNYQYYEPKGPDSFPGHDIDGFLGYLYKQAQTPELAEKPDTIKWYDVNYKDHIEISDEYVKDGETIHYDSALFASDKEDYDFFLGGDQPLTELTNTERPGERTILILKDSYCNAFAPWLINNYGKVILVDPRIYEGSFKKLVERYEPDDVLIMNYIFTTTFADYCQMAIDMFD